MDYDNTFQNIPAGQIFNPNSESPLMDEALLCSNVDAIYRDIELLKELFQNRLETSEQQTEQAYGQISLSWPSLDSEPGPYAELCKNLSDAERLLVLFTLLPHYAPEILRELVASVQQGLIVSNYHIGGYLKRTSQQFIPTLQTVLFTIAGENKAQQQLAYRELILEGSLLKRQIVTLRSFENSEPVISDKE